MHPSQPAQLRQLFDQPVCLCYLAVTELSAGPFSRHVHVHGGQPERTLQGALDSPDALRLLQGDPRRGAVQPARDADGVHTVVAGGEEVEAQRRLQPGPWGRGRAHGIGRPEEAGQEVPGVLLGAHGQERLAHDARSLAALVAGRCACDVDLEAAPAEGPPQERLHLADGLDPPVGDRLGDRLQEAAANPYPFGAFHRDEPVLPGEPPPDDTGEAEQVHRQEPGHRRGRPRFELVEHRQGRDGNDQDDADQRQHDRAEQAPQRHACHGEADVARHCELGLVVPSQQDEAELGRLRLGEIGQPAIGRPGSGEADAQLGDAEHAGEERAYDVDRLDSGQGQAPRVLADQPGLDAQRVPLEAPPGDHPVHVPVDGGDQGDDDEVVGLDRAVLGLGVDRRDEEKKEKGRDQPADPRHGREGMETAPALRGR